MKVETVQGKAHELDYDKDEWVLVDKLHQIGIEQIEDAGTTWIVVCLTCNWLKVNRFGENAAYAGARLHVAGENV